MPDSLAKKLAEGKANSKLMQSALSPEQGNIKDIKEGNIGYSTVVIKVYDEIYKIQT